MKNDHLRTEKEEYLVQIEQELATLQFENNMLRQKNISQQKRLAKMASVPVGAGSARPSASWSDSGDWDNDIC